MDQPPLLSRYELARLLGMRALQISEGDAPLVHVSAERLRCDPTYVAARELESRVLDVRVQRTNGTVEAMTARFPPQLRALLDTRDGGAR